MPREIIDPLSQPYHIYPIALLDFFWVVSIYVISAACLVILIDGHILPQFSIDETRKRSSFRLAGEILGQLALQGFIAVFLAVALQRLPSPVHGMYGYDPHASLGLLLRNPAIVYIILFSQSKSLQGKMQVFMSRFDKNAIVTIPEKR